MELYAANRQWATRPADERFRTLDDMYDTCKYYHDTARQSTFTLAKTSIESKGGEVILRGQNAESGLTHHAFGKLCTLVGAPTEYMRSLPSDLSVENLRHGIREYDGKENPLKGLFQVRKDNSLICRCMTSTIYQRIWNYEIVDKLRPLTAEGWNTPPSRTDATMPSGLYASDHDMFVFLVNENNRIHDGSEEGLARGFFTINNETGDGSFKVMSFYYKYVCGNHIVWGAKDVQTIRIIHKGTPARNWENTLRVELTKYANSSVSDEQAKIERARTLTLGKDIKEVIDALFSKRSLGIAKRDLESAYLVQETRHELDRLESPPNTVWGMVNGLTRISQQLEYADARTDLDTKAGKVLEMAF